MWWGFHGCDYEVADAVVSKRIRLAPSLEENEWLGSGIYFFIGSLEMAASWAQMRKDRARIKRAAVLRMKISVAEDLCLDLSDLAQAKLLKSTYLDLERLCASAGISLPVNSRPKDGVMIDRKLDCAVIDFLHFMRRLSGLPAYQAVVGAFEDGPALYPGSSFREKTHLQVAVRDYACLSEPSIEWSEQIAV